MPLNKMQPSHAKVLSKRSSGEVSLSKEEQWPLIKIIEDFIDLAVKADESKHGYDRMLASHKWDISPWA